MFAKIPEPQMRRVRWVLTIGWLLLIVSLFYDPISAGLTYPTTTISPLRLDPAICVKVQGKCLEEVPYALAAPIFWGIIIPSAIFILLVFGHEFWRRICPLSFLSQIPRALGWQRQRQRTDATTGRVRKERVKVAKNSWLARNYLYLQFGLLFLGLCSRILFINCDRLALGLFLVATILAAITVGYLYDGKSWCQYFCPMAPVQKIYAEPRGLLTSTAHETDGQTITQSMCRSIKEHKDHSACVACQSPCIDIDAERSYWDGITKPEQQWLYYGYVGLVVGYFVYYYLYAGNWEYYLSGAWAHQENQLSTLFSPGFYLFDHPIPIPKLVAVPLTLAVFTVGGYFLGRKLEKRYKAYGFRNQEPLSSELIRHRIFTLCTFFSFNFFFIFAGRNFIRLLPISAQYLFPILIAVSSTLWLYRTWQRNPHLYQRESLATRLRKQLIKLNVDTSRFLEGRSLDSLNADEVYVLAKILPGFSKEKRLQAYKGVLREAIEQGDVDYSSSQKLLQQMRQELAISDEQHQAILTELGAEDPDLFNPTQPHTHEDWWRLEGYREAIVETIAETWKQRPAQGLAADLFDVVAGKKSFESIDDFFDDLSEDESETVQTIRREYGVTAQEEKQVLRRIDPYQLWQTIGRTLDILDRTDTVSEEHQPTDGETVDRLERENQRWLQRFRLFDVDGSGYISSEELRVCVREIDSQVTDAEIEEMLKLADTNSDDQISYEEFYTLFQGFKDRQRQESSHESAELGENQN